MAPPLLVYTAWNIRFQGEDFEVLMDEVDTVFVAELLEFADDFDAGGTELSEHAMEG
jgi:hypothetical protein